MQIRVEQALAPCTAPEALAAPPAPILRPVTLLVFVLARKATASSFSLLYLHFLQQLPVTYVSVYELPGPAPAFFPTYFERGVAVSISAIFTLAIIAPVVGMACE